ncbi:MAG: hypothetical protein ABL925_11855 [Methylococcales bacterium]
MPTLDHWRQTWSDLGVTASEQDFYELINAYISTGRYYHTDQHLQECLNAFTELKDLAAHPAEIACAIWFHDAIYEPLAYTNELRSAEWAKNCLLKQGVAEPIIARIIQLILVTQHNALPTELDQQIMIDADLSILGAAPQRFAEYEQQIRQEYALVSDQVFAEKRAELLHGFLARTHIFSTARFIDRYELSARYNINQSLEYLSV